ncbi:NAD-dependent epimerase/dehydratase family protein [Rhodococcus sp. SGAir0479]|uniref:NAD-dependent epimerase/dehydratase family protein n=1 Tax=Rhodococcus sp. SGAir0479 TaxID=2567884 RepID=UPI0010CD6C20|nr:NAD-dependent epimerase/dehydratase family protein [Rhodococcus sp. SGAir0479]QCQ91332.1 NAD-dependent epimerase/dehydratase family protein [Rhodococcus sp. SGAir0479]
MRVAVTGATGNLGTAVLRRLRQDGEHEIVGVARRRPPDEEPYAGTAWHTVDVAAPDAAERLRVPFAGADAVVHLAWGFQPTHRRRYLGATGVHGTGAALAAAAHCGVRHVIHVSSSAVYSPGSYGRPVDESWPTTGVQSSVYSQDKVAAERTIAAHVASGAGPAVTVLRPGLIGQYQAGNQLLHYILPDWVPAGVLRLAPLVVIDKKLCIPAVHADDAADAIVRALGHPRSRVYNLASDVPATGADVLAGLSAVGVDVPASALRFVADATWRLHVQPVDGGWVDLAYATPLVDAARIRDELGWTARTDGPAVVREVVDGMVHRAGTGSPVLADRSVRERLGSAVRRGSVGVRKPT